MEDRAPPRRSDHLCKTGRLADTGVSPAQHSLGSVEGGDRQFHGSLRVGDGLSDCR